MTPSRFTLLTLLLVGATTPAAAQDCLAREVSTRRGASYHNSTRTDDDRKLLQVRWRRGDCELRVDARGDFGVRADLRGFTTVENGGYVQIEELDGDVERRLRVTGTANGLSYRWTVDGKEGFDVDRDRWLAGYLMALERRTAMFAKARIPELLREGGPKAVIDETARMESDYPRRVYLTTLMASTRLDEPTMERLLRLVGDSMSSDFERAELLRAVAKQGPMTDRVTRAVIRVAQSMSSDFEKRRALSAALESVTSGEARLAVFNAASTMSSSFELAELLIAAQAQSMVDSTSSTAYFRAVDRLTSDFEHRRTLSALLKRRPESPEVLAGVLRSSATIASDFERATLLVEFARVIPVRGEIRELYLKAARSINSDFEYRRALQALLEQDRRT